MNNFLTIKHLFTNDIKYWEFDPSLSIYETAGLNPPSHIIMNDNKDNTPKNVS